MNDGAVHGPPGASVVGTDAGRRRGADRARRCVVRVAASATVLGALVALPVAVFGMLRLPLPTSGDWRSALDGTRLDEELAVSIGGAVFLVLWTWFAASAVGECWRAVRWRSAGTPPPALAPGPTRWLRHLVRLAVLAGTSATLVAGVTGVGPTSRSSAGGPLGGARDAVVAHVSSTDGPAPIRATALRAGGTGARRASPGGASADAADAADPLRRGTEPMDRDPDGVIDRAPSVPEHPIESALLGIPTPNGLVSTVMFVAGALALLDAARRRRLRSAVLGSRSDPPSLAQVRTEMLLRSLDSSEQLMRLDIALRAVSGALAEQHALVHTVIVGRLGDIRLLPSAGVRLPSPWASSAVPPSVGWWSLPATVSLEQLAEQSHSDAPPCPALVHLGAVEDGECFVDLEALGVLEVETETAGRVVRAVSASLAVSPFLDAGRVVDVVGPPGARTGGSETDDDAHDGDGLIEPGRHPHHARVDPDGRSRSAGGDRRETVDSVDAALEVAAVLLGDTADAIGTCTTFERRVESAGGEAWEPVIIVADAVEPRDVEMLRSVVLPGRGLGAIVGRADADATAASRRSPVEDAPAGRWLLRRDPSGPMSHVLEPCGVRLTPAAAAPREVSAVFDLLEAESHPFEVAASVVAIGTARSSTALHGVDPLEPFVEPEWALLVRTLGAVEVVSADGTLAEFDRSKALELVVWLAMHRRRPTRGAARAALWDLDVRDATFANVVSDARRALARASMPPPGVEWIPRTLTESLPLHERVVSDADLLDARMRYAAPLAHRDAIDVLTPGLELVTGMPFAGSNFLWCDAEGHASALVLAATGAATRLAQHHLALGDVEGVFWATGQGLLVLSGHEELVALRMRAYAGAGDLAGVRSEWERYERALSADPWAAAQPSPKLSSLRRELLGRTG